MGGGDLNLKKSWHPSTMRNMEKVWKAEQKHDLEKKRIAELQREIQQEKAREDLTKFAEDQGVVEKKSGDVKLDWMYKGPGTHVDHEEYLLGKAIDKNFEQLQRSQQQRSSSISVPGRTDTCLPGSIFAGSGEQVDIARKLQEDPLLAIRKKEIESRSQILKNPVKLKQLKEMIKQQKSSKSHSKHKKEKKKKKKNKKKSKHSSDSDGSDEDSDLDAKLLAKYQKLKEKLGGDALTMLQKSPGKTESETREKHRKRTHSSSSDFDSSSDKVELKKKSTKGYGLQLPHGAKVRNPVTHTVIKEETKRKPVDKVLPSTQSTALPQKKQKLTEEEKERRRQEMLANGAWRERERQSNVARYREAEKKEQNQAKREFSDEFLREQLSKAAAQSTVASRIKSNINNIQRYRNSMDKNFARR